MRGFRPEEVPSHVDSWITGIHPDDLPRVKQRLDDCLRRRVPGLRVRAARPNQVRPVDLDPRSRQGVRARRPRRAHPHGRDRAGHHRAQATRRRSCAWPRRSRPGSSRSPPTRSSPSTSDQRITMFNEGAERIFGYAKAEAIGAPLDILIPERLASHPPPARRAVRGGQRGRAAHGRARRDHRGPAQERRGVSRRRGDLQAGRRRDDHPDGRAARHHRAEARRARAAVPGGGRTWPGGRPRLRRGPVQGRAAGGRGSSRTSASSTSSRRAARSTGWTSPAAIPLVAGSAMP